jgi:hypothetical protein
MEGVDMDSERFDGLVRSFGQTRSRRQTLRGLAALVAGGAFVLGGREASAGTCKPEGRVCKTSGQCCDGLVTTFCDSSASSGGHRVGICSKACKPNGDTTCEAGSYCCSGCCPGGGGPGHPGECVAAAGGVCGAAA